MFYKAFTFNRKTPRLSCIRPSPKIRAAFLHVIDEESEAQKVSVT
jgi:hypothetical protein